MKEHTLEDCENSGRDAASYGWARNPWGHWSEFQIEAYNRGYEEESSRLEALAEYPAHKKQQEQEECPHDEHDHGICLDCGKDVWDDVVGAAEFHADCLEDR